MSEQEIRAAVLKVLATIALEADLSTLADQQDFRDALDIDSMDFLNVAIGLAEQLGVEVPERDYPKLSTLAGCIAYLKAKTATNA